MHWSAAPSALMWRQLAAVADAQFGVITRTQALEAGISYDSQRRRLASGHWRELYGVLVVTPGEPDHQHAWAAWLRLKRRGVITGLTGIRLQGVTGVIPDRMNPAEQTLMVAVPPETHTVVRNIRIIRDAIDRSHTDRVGVPVATRRELILDCLMYLDPRSAVRILDCAVGSGATTLVELEAGLAERAIRGRRGVSQLRRLVAVAREGARSDFERRALPLLRRVRGARFQPNLQVVVGPRTYVLDAADPGLRLAIEFDGFAYHSGRVEFDSDRSRQNDLLLAGWTVLRFTWRQVMGDPRDVLRQIQVAVDRARAA